MARSRVGDRLEHILDAIPAIEGFCAGKTEGHFRTDRMLRDAVERNLERISEASRHIPDDLKAYHPQISWRGIADIGNVLRHGYDQVLDTRVWQVVTMDLPELKAVAESMRASLKNPQRGSG